MGYVLLAALEREVRAVLAHGALETQHDLLGGLGLLLEDGLGLTTVTLLLAHVTTLTLRKVGRLAGLVLGHLVGPVGVSRDDLEHTYVCFRQVLPLQ